MLMPLCKLNKYLLNLEGAVELRLSSTIANLCHNDSYNDDEDGDLQR